MLGARRNVVGERLSLGCLINYIFHRLSPWLGGVTSAAVWYCCSFSRRFVLL